MSRSRRPIYYVEWEDSETWSGWGKPEKFPKPGLCTTVGFLVCEERRYLVFASSHDGDNSSVNCIIRIPKVAIRRKRKMRDPNA